MDKEKILNEISKTKEYLADFNEMRNNKWVYAFSKGYATARWELINPILNIINKVKE